jgi:hypothetical protein
MRENPPSTGRGQLGPETVRDHQKKERCVAILSIVVLSFSAWTYGRAPKSENAASGTADISQDQRWLPLFFQARCGRSSRISAEQTRSVADNLMENSKNSDGAQEEGALCPL